MDGALRNRRMPPLRLRPFAAAACRRPRSVGRRRRSRWRRRGGRLSPLRCLDEPRRRRCIHHRTPLWPPLRHVRQGHGSSLTFEFGAPQQRIREVLHVTGSGTDPAPSSSLMRGSGMVGAGPWSKVLGLVAQKRRHFSRSPRGLQEPAGRSRGPSRSVSSHKLWTSRRPLGRLNSLCWCPPSRAFRLVS